MDKIHFTFSYLLQNKSETIFYETMKKLLVNKLASILSSSSRMAHKPLLSYKTSGQYLTGEEALGWKAFTLTDKKRQ